MPPVRKLSTVEINRAVAGAVDRRVPVTVSVRTDQGWENLYSRFLDQTDEHVLLEMPRAEDAAEVRTFQEADRLGISFKFKHHKHVFTGTVAGTGTHSVGGRDVPVLRVCLPTQMHCLQRRVFTRVDVPAGRIVRASFWSGTLATEPTVDTVEAPVWSGQVINLSAGGVQVRCDHSAAGALELGESVGMHLSFELGKEAVSTEAQFRHVEAAKDGVLLGFQFLGLEQTAEGRETVKHIGHWVGEFQRDAKR